MFLSRSNSGGARQKLLAALVIFLFASAVYLYVFPSPTLIYVAVVLLHAGLGVLAAVFLIPKLIQLFSARNFWTDSGWWLIGFGAILGIILIFIGTSRPQWNW